MIRYKFRNTNATQTQQCSQSTYHSHNDETAGFELYRELALRNALLTVRYLYRSNLNGGFYPRYGHWITSYHFHLPLKIIQQSFISISVFARSQNIDFWSCRYPLSWLDPKTQQTSVQLIPLLIIMRSGSCWSMAFLPTLALANASSELREIWLLFTQ